ncbi:hypothetical protein GCM10009641_16610 [Mycobacterium cookii]|uniref:Uncharacterized protein n=1 Tax=Mycobacterium cookii TaxID=1775 RepID=A0A7I7L000_9MYCO|nr:hypothetical protein [Mycobacterium cookii]MCV7330350.1 hypothetical protein [Mycobacterium cookii]BBX47463.1 hypothetical protein MCOO_34780 [Mycobacterium cookii]
METFDVDYEKRRPRASGGSVKYRLDVIASSSADVVGSVGGWLYDRVRAGWDVNVLLPRGCDSRPLQILGMRAVDLDAQTPLADTDHPIRGLAVSADMYAADARIKQAVLCALDRWMTEVTLWHDDWPLVVGHRTTRVQHVLSGAARAFKRHALAAAGIPGIVGPTEALLSDMKASLPVDSELIPVG